MKRVALAVALWFASTTAAQAETFGFSTTGRVNEKVGGRMVAGPPASAAISTTAGQMTWASGATVTLQSTCALWTGTPGAQLQYSGVCDDTLSNGEANRMTFGCKPLGPDGSEADCWGRLDGLAGSRAGRVGTISFHVWGVQQ